MTLVGTSGYHRSSRMELRLVIELATADEVAQEWRHLSVGGAFVRGAVAEQQQACTLVLIARGRTPLELPARAVYTSAEGVGVQLDDFGAALRQRLQAWVDDARTSWRPEGSAAFHTSSTRHGSVWCEIGVPGPSAVTEAFTRLGPVMAKADARANQVDRAVIELAEAATLSGREGESFAAVVTDVDEYGVRIQLRDAPVAARVTAHGVAPGDPLTVRLDAADPIKRTVSFSRIA